MIRVAMYRYSPTPGSEIIDNNHYDIVRVSGYAHRYSPVSAW